MTQYIDKSAVVAEIEKLQNSTIDEDGNFYSAKAQAEYNILCMLEDSIDTLEVKEMEDFIWNNTRTTVPEDSTNQIICIKEDGLAVSTIGKIVNGTVKWAYLDDLLNTNSFNVEVKEEPVSEDLEEAAKKAATWHSRVRGDVFFHNDYQKFIEGAKWQEAQTIEKACAWLSNVCIEDMTYKYDDFDTSEGWYKFIEDFKQAMNK